MMLEEAKAVPYEATLLPSPGDAIVFAPHPDDEVFGCGGAILAHVRHGHSVEVVIATDGGQQGESVDIRRQESIAASAVLGYGRPEFWDFPDRSLRYSERLVTQMQERIARKSASVVYAPSPWEVHPDHLALAMAAIEAVRRIGEGCVLILYEVGSPLQPNVLLDLSPYLDKKREASRCFASQLSVYPYDKCIEGLNRFRSYTLGPKVEAAEAFTLVQGAELRARGPYFLYQSLTDCRRAQRIRVDAPDLPLVSIITPPSCGQSYSLIARSIALQTYPNIETILLESAQAEAVLDLSLGAFSERRIRTAPSLGWGGTIRAGLRASEGAYCLILEAGCSLDPDHVERLVNALKDKPRYVAAYADVAVMGPKDETVSSVYNAEFDLLRIVIKNQLPIHAALLRSDCVNQSLDALPIRGCRNSWELWMALVGHGDFLHVAGVSARVERGSAGDRDARRGIAGVADDTSARAAPIESIGQFWSTWDSSRLSELLSSVGRHLHNAEQAPPRLEQQRAESQVHWQRMKQAVGRECEPAVSPDEGVEIYDELLRRSAELDLVYRSRSWRLTAGLRRLGRWMRSGRAQRRTLDTGK